MKRTLITGASTGLGKELAKLYALDNNDLILVARNESKLNEVKNEILQLANVKCDIVVADLSIKEEWEKVYNYTKDKGYFVNNLVNNAGFGDRTDFLEMDIDFQIKMTEVNCNSALYLTRMFLPMMVEHNEGHIINVASIAGFMPGPFMATYHATKGYLLFETFNSSKVNFSNSFFLEVACLDFEALALNLAINSCNSLAFASFLLFNSLACFCNNWLVSYQKS